MGEPHNSQIKRLLAEAHALTGEEQSLWMSALRRRDPAAAEQVAALLQALELGAHRFDNPFATATDEEDIAAGQILCLRYQIVAKAGAGATAEVFEAEDLLVARRRVAIKIMRRGVFGEQWRSAEVATLATLNHSGIASVLDSGTLPGGRGFLVTRFAKGRTLAQSPGVLGGTPKAIARFGRKIGEALSYAHRRGVLHRDIRPANIIVDDWGGPTESVVLIDFGLAALESKPGALHATRGPLDRYQAPETHSGIYEAASDLYSASLVLRELFTANEMPGPWRRFFNAALHTDSTKRPKSAAEWVAIMPGDERRSLWPGALAVAAIALVLLAWLVFTRVRTPPDWAAPTPVTTRVGAENWPVWTAGSQSVYFLSKGPPTDGVIFQASLESGGVTPILTSTANRSHLSLAKDGTSLLFLEYGEQGHTAIIHFDLDAKKRQRQAAGYINSFCTGERDELLYVSARVRPGTPHRLYRVDTRTGSWSPLTDPKSGYGDIHPQLHPNGRKLLFVRQIDDGEFALFVSGIASDGALSGAPTQLGSGFPVIRTPRWLGNSGAIAMVAGSQANQLLWQTDPGQAPRSVPVAGDHLRELAVSRDGRSIIVSRSRRDPNLYRAAKKEGSWVLTPIASSSRSDSLPVLSPDGGRLAFISDRSGRNQVWVAETSGNRVNRIPTPEATDNASLGWEPDGKRLIITVPSKRSARHLAYEPATGLLAEVTFAGTFVLPSVTPESYLTHRERDTAVPGWWRHYYDARPPVLVAPGRRVTVSEAVDASAVFYSVGPDFQGIYRQDRAGTTVQIFANHRIHHEILQARRSGLYFATFEGSQSVVWRYEFATRRAERLFTSKARLGAGLSVSADEQEIYLTIVENDDTDLYLLQSASGG